MCALYFTVVQLILWTSIPRSFTASQVTYESPRLNILFLTDKPLSQKTKTLLTQFETKLTNSTTWSPITVQLTIKVLPQNVTTILDTLYVLSNCVRWEETAIIILNFNDEKVRKMVLCGYKGLVFDIKTRPRNMQQVLYLSTKRNSIIDC